MTSARRAPFCGSKRTTGRCAALRPYGSRKGAHKRACSRTCALPSMLLRSCTLTRRGDGICSTICDGVSRGGAAADSSRCSCADGRDALRVWCKCAWCHQSRDERARRARRRRCVPRKPPAAAATEAAAERQKGHTLSARRLSWRTRPPASAATAAGATSARAVTRDHRCRRTWARACACASSTRVLSSSSISATVLISAPSVPPQLRIAIMHAATCQRWGAGAAGAAAARRAPVRRALGHARGG